MPPLAYVSGLLLPASEAMLPVHDAGIVSGATVTDYCRTFRHRLFRWQEHLARFRRDCSECFIPLPQGDEELTGMAQRLVEHNSGLLPPGGELALVTFATPGGVGTYAGTPGIDGPPTLVMHTLPLSFDRYRRFFDEGVSLALAGRHSADPDDLLPVRLKHRSRLHWWRADHLLRRRTDLPPGTLALLADADGRLTETAVGNLLVVRGGVVLSPPRESILDGISLRVVRELCGAEGIEFDERRLSLDDVRSASEAMLCGSAFCLAGVRWVEGVAVPWPGAVAVRLQRAWEAMVGAPLCGQSVAAR